MLALEELTASTCHWPVAEFERGVFLYCGELVDASLSPTMRVYRPRHARLDYRRSGDWSSRVSPGTIGGSPPLLQAHMPLEKLRITAGGRPGMVFFHGRTRKICEIPVI